jgi:membrane peptidoglycan carboxypeptidase
MAWSVPEVSCGDALASMPKGLLARLDGMSMQGTFGAHGRLAFDAKAPEKTEVDLSLEQKCRVTKVPPQLSLDRFRQPFELRVYDPKGNPKMQTFGPGTPEWVSLDRISPYVVDAVLTCEDAAFFGHKGFSAVSIRNALIANIKSGKFALGASTVTMQLAKNIFLERRKQLARKLEEAVLTAWLEQGMSKSELLELYLNVIEYGPNLYGIGPAAMHYFGRPARDLDPLEAMFLVSILPSPVKRHVMWEKGQIGDAYLKYLRFLLKEAHARGKLEDDEYEAAATRPFTFHKPGDPPPAPHSPPSGKSSIEKNDGDPAYDPVWAPPPE